MSEQQLSIFKENLSGCEGCKFYSELKEPRERTDGSVIYGYCFKDGDRGYDLNMGKGFAVFMPEGYCKKKVKQRRKR